MVQWLNNSITIFALGIAPLFFLLSIAYKKKYKNIVLSWRKPVMVIPTILCFTINLTLFILAAFFFATYFGKIQGIKILEYPASKIYILGIDCILAMFGTTLFYFSLENYFTQMISSNGIIFRQWDWSQWRFSENKLYWEQINDYYVKFDYPVSIFTFITYRNGSLEKISLSVPFYALPRFEQLLESQMDFIQLQREQLKEISKKNSF